MSGVELKVVLVGGDEAEQRAFNRPLEDQQREAAHTSPASPPDATTPAPAGASSPPAAASAPPQTPEPPPIAPAANPTDAPAEAAQSAQERVFVSMEALTNRIEELLKLELAAKNKPQQSPEAKNEPPDTTFGKLIDRIDRFVAATERAINKSMGRFGKTRPGKAVSSGIARARKAATSAGKAFASSKFGRKVAAGVRGAGNVAHHLVTKAATARAGQAAVGAAGRAAAGAGASAAGGAAGAGVAGAVAAVAAPVAVLTLAVGGAALTVKSFSDAVHNAAEGLTDLSPALATVRAQIDVTREMQRLDRANRIGAGAAQLEAARGRIAESTYEVQTKILEVVLKFAPLIEGVLDAVNSGLRGVDLIVAALNVVASRIDDVGGNFANNAPADEALEKSLKAFSDSVMEIFRNGAPDQLNGMDPWLADVLKMPGPGGGGAAPQMPPDNPGNFP